MTLFDHSGGKQNNKMARGLVLMLVSLVEAIGFGLNFLPLETLTVVALYMMAREAWKKEHKRLEAQSRVQSNAERIREYQMAQMTARMAEQAANEASFREGSERQEAANDTQYSRKPVRKIL